MRCAFAIVTLLAGCGSTAATAAAPVAAPEPSVSSVEIEAKSVKLAPVDTDTDTEKSFREPPPRPLPLDCDDLIGDVATYAPEIAVAAGPDREWAIAMRQLAVTDACEGAPTTPGWSQATRACFHDAHDPDSVTQCRAALEPARAQALAQRVGDLDAIVAKSFAARRKGSVDCNRVVASYYRDSAWNGKLTDLTPAERKTEVASSRAAMAKACVDEGWIALVRACVIIGGGDACFDAGGSSSTIWGFPAIEALASTGIPECDAYGHTIAALGRCDKLPPATRRMFDKTFRQAADDARRLPTDQRPRVAQMCTVSTQLVQHMSAQFCP